ncbi:hypothetical protein [Anaerotignum sp.]
MKTLSEKEKEIIRLIQKKEIYDIFSFVEYYELGKSVVQTEDEIENRFLEEFGDTRFKCAMTRLDYFSNPVIDEKIDEKYVWAKPRLSYLGARGIVLGTDQVKEVFSYFSTVYICENIREILHFVAVWEYLLSEGLVIELPKPFEKRDIGLFVRKDEISREKSFIETLEGKDVIYLSDMEISVKKFLAWDFIFDEINFELCSEYLQKRIYPTLGLDTFIEKGFRTKNDLEARRNFWIALAGVAVAIITSFISIMISLTDKGYYDEFGEMKDSLEKISERMESNEEKTGVKIILNNKPENFEIEDLKVD